MSCLIFLALLPTWADPAAGPCRLPPGAHAYAASPPANRSHAGDVRARATGLQHETNAAVNQLLGILPGSRHMNLQFLARGANPRFRASAKLRPAHRLAGLPLRSGGAAAQALGCARVVMSSLPAGLNSAPRDARVLGEASGVSACRGVPRDWLAASDPGSPADVCGGGPCFCGWWRRGGWLR